MKPDFARLQIRKQEESFSEIQGINTIFVAVFASQEKLNYLHHYSAFSRHNNYEFWVGFALNVNYKRRSAIH